MDTQELMMTITQQLQQVAGIAGVVLGGSRARGTHTEQSDIDLGLYYHSKTPLDLSALRHLATQLDDRHLDDVITDLGEWGPWINGGGWLRIHVLPWIFCTEMWTKSRLSTLPASKDRSRSSISQGIHTHFSRLYIWQR